MHRLLNQDPEQVRLLQGQALVNAVATAMGWSSCRKPTSYYDIRFHPDGAYYWTGITAIRKQDYWPLDAGTHVLALLLYFKLAIEPRGETWFVWSLDEGAVTGFESASLPEAICRTVALNFLEDPKPDLAGNLPKGTAAGTETCAQ